MSVGRHISLLNVACPGQTGWESRGAIISNLIPLINIPVPPMLEQALGYEGQHRYVAFWWEPAGDELAWNDGQCSIVGANWHTWLTYVQHPHIAPYLEPYELGSSDEQARHWLLLDRQERMLYVGTTPDVARFLAQHTPPAPAITPGEDTISLEDALNVGIDELLASMREIPPPSQAEIRRRMEEQAGLDADLKTWLDHQIKSINRQMRYELQRLSSGNLVGRGSAATAGAVGNHGERALTERDSLLDAKLVLDKHDWLVRVPEPVDDPDSDIPF